MFNTEKLDWMNGQYITRLPIDRLAALVAPFFAEEGLQVDVSSPWFHRLLDLLRPRTKRLTDFVELARPFLADTVEYKAEAVEKHLTSSDLGSSVSALADALRTTDPFDEPHVEAVVRRTAAERSIKAGMLIHATRVAVTGREVEPGAVRGARAARP